VSNPADVEKYGISNVQIHIVEKAELVWKRRTIHVYVDNLGGKDEAAFFDERHPMPTLRPQTVTEYVEQADGSVYEKRKIVALDGTEKVIAQKSTTLEATK